MISRRYPPKMRTVTDKRRTLFAPKTRGKLQERRRVETAVRQAGQRRTPFAAALQPPFFEKQKAGRVVRPAGIVFTVVFGVACAWLRRALARRTRLCQAHATVPTVTF